MIAGTYDTVPIDYARDGAKLLLQLRHTTEYDDVLDFHITRGIQRLKINSTVVKNNCKIPVCNGFSAKLPKGLIQLLAIRVPCGETVENSDAERGVNYTIYIDKNFFKDCNDSSSYGSWENTMQIRDGYIYFNQEISEAEIEIAYKGTNVDENGDMIIYERYLPALEFYAASMFGLSNPKLYPQWSQWKTDFINEKKALAGEDIKNIWDLQKRQIWANMRNWYYRPNTI
jgi:hypothetical protein